MRIGKRVLLCLWLSLLAVGLRAQQPTRVEYFFDHDPGHGQATSIQTVAEGENLLSLSTNGLDPGAHILFMRSLGSNGVWSTTEAHAFYLASHRSDEIARLEYFFDTDPGFGQGIPVSGELNGERALALSTEGLQPGSHILCLRAQGKQGEWSSVSISKFYLLSTSSANIRRVEYFFDTDPGHGQGRTLTEVREGEQQLALSTDGLSEGAHILFLRTQTDDGVWSSTEAHPFYVSKALPTRPTQVEYFFDTDPGYGKGQHVAATEGENNLTLSLGDLGYGAHILFTRVSDDQGGWSAVEAHPFFICDREGFVAMEYYFDTDPGQGQGTPVTLPLYFRNSDPLVISAPTDELLPGDHTINLRGMDKEGNWSEITTRSFRINGPELELAKEVQYAYNGRYVSMSSETEGATIRYTLDGSEPTASSPAYTGATDVGGLVTIRAIAMKEGLNPSNPTQLAVPCYYDGEVAQVRTAGTLVEAFGWCDAQEIERLAVKGNLDDTDYATLRTLQALRHVDLKEVVTANQSIPDNALAATGLVTAELPTALTSAGAMLFAGCEQLAAIGWNANIAVPSVTLQGIDNPNLLLYVGQAAQAQQTGIRNIVANGQAESITLSDAEGNANFFALRPFVAERISYAHIYGLETGYSELYGWETLSLPFDVQTITHETRGRLTPFAQATGSRDEHPFWLCQLTAGGWQEAPSVQANVPYIVAMPNNEVYSDQYQLAGQVTYAATNVNVPATVANEAQSGTTRFLPTTLSVAASDQVYALNRDRYEEYREGSVFVRNLREVRPFEAYCSSTVAGPHLMPIKDGMSTGIRSMDNEMVNAKWSNGKCFDLSGRQINRVVKKGVYIVNGKKVLIK